MSRFLLDTNVLSEAGKAEPHPAVMAFLVEQTDIFVSVMSLHEIEYGIALLPAGRRRKDLEASMEAVIAALGKNILDVESEVAKLAARFRAGARGQGRALHLPDAFIAATAKEHDLKLATRNVSDFDYLGVNVIDPWAA
jgi:predicted nucleic acid-binding protein